VVEERAFWLAWSQISGIGPVLLSRLQQHFGTLAAAWEADPVQLRQVEGFGLQTIEEVNKQRSRQILNNFSSSISSKTRTSGHHQTQIIRAYC